jgi:hypothetical protein
VESNWVHSAPRSPIGLLCQTRWLWWWRNFLVMIDRGNRSTQRKSAPVPLCPLQTPHAVRTRTRAAAVGSQRLTAWTTARPSINGWSDCLNWFGWLDQFNDLMNDWTNWINECLSDLLDGLAVTNWTVYFVTKSISLRPISHEIVPGLVNIYQANFLSVYLWAYINPLLCQ